MKGIVVFTTKHGCTGKAVKLLQSKIPEEIKTVDVAREKAPDLSLFDTVILGGPIHIGKMDKVLSSYMQQNIEVVKGIKEDYSRLSEVKIDKLAKGILDTKAY